MNLMLFADGDWVQILIVVAIFASWIIRHVVQGIREEPPRPERPRPAERPRPQPVRRPEANRPPVRQQPQRPQEELDQFLKELGVKGEHQRPKPPERPKPVTRRKPHKPARTRPEPVEVAPPQTESQTVGQRHLRSRIDERKPDPKVAQLEEQHLRPTIMRADAESQRAGAMPTPAAASRAQADHVLIRMLQDKGQLPRAFILGEVLGPPLALKDRR